MANIGHVSAGLAFFVKSSPDAGRFWYVAALRFMNRYGEPDGGRPWPSVGWPQALLALALLLAGCSGSLSKSPALTPAGAAIAGESAARTGNLANVIYVVPVEGAAPMVGMVLADAIAAEIRDKNRPAILANEPNQAGASVVSRIEAAERRGDVVWITLLWALRAPYGTEVASYRQQIVVDAAMWEQGAPEPINLLIGDAAPRILDMIATHVGPSPDIQMSHRGGAQPPAEATAAKPLKMAAAPAAPTITIAPVTPPAVPVGNVTAVATPQNTGVGQKAATDTPIGPVGAPRALSPGAATIANAAGSTDEGILTNLVPSLQDTVERRPGDARPGPSQDLATVRWGRPSFLIKPVTGAPGNGNQALTAALKTALRDRDITISEDPRQAGFQVQGVVEMGPQSNGRQFTRIVWRVNTMAGQEVGKAVQENTVVAGSLDGEWGQVAEVVSHAAVRGIRELFGEADSKMRAAERLPEFPAGAVPQVPGRAPPPPPN